MAASTGRPPKHHSVDTRPSRGPCGASLPAWCVGRGSRPSRGHGRTRWHLAHAQRPHRSPSGCVQVADLQISGASGLYGGPRRVSDHRCETQQIRRLQASGRPEQATPRASRTLMRDPSIARGAVARVHRASTQPPLGGRAALLRAVRRILAAWCVGRGSRASRGPGRPRWHLAQRRASAS